MVERTPKILIVDDDPRLRDLLRRYLGENGFNVLVSENGEAMKRLWVREHFDVLILDLMMPGEDGLAILKRLRAEKDMTPVIMLTARGEDVDRILGLELGADDYLGKPFNPRELLARIHAVLRRRAVEFKYTPCIGRTHGIHAEATTFGLKLCNWMAEIERDIDRMKHAKETISVGKISGAVGTYADIDPFVEKYVCEHLGIAASPISSQTLQRDRHAEYVTTLAVIASSIDKMATEIRHLQRTEVREAEEYFSPKQKGSSIMPHKRNPITCERMCGLARVIRGNAQAALEDVALWHERDISHSSVERVILPDSTIALDYMLQTFTRVIDKLLVYPDKMMKDLNLTGGLIYSPIILNTLVEKGAVREQAYRWVQRNAMKRWLEGEDFLENLKKDEDVMKYMTAEEIEGCFDVKKMLSHVDTIFARFGI